MSTPQPTGPNQGAPLQNVMPRSLGKNYLDPRIDAIDLTYYTTLVQALAPAASLPSQINIDAGTDFYWVATTYQADVGEVAQTESSIVIPLVTVIITDTGSQRQLMNQATPITNIAGPGERPYRLILPRLFRANSIITFNWTSYVTTGTTYGNIYLTMHGFRMPPGTPFAL
jgi:hypothetical protein